MGRGRGRKAPPAGRSGTPAEVEAAASAWLERVLLPAVSRQGDQGWDLLRAVDDVRKRAQAAGHAASVKAATALRERINLVGRAFFRVHPKGVGLVCCQVGGLAQLTFVEEYLGEVHAPWRWFEIQDAIKKGSSEALPDFYNIMLERPRDCSAGFDVLFIDAASKGACVSRMSHSCAPNCQAVVVAAGGRLTIAVYTLRAVSEGEELTFDYASVTESEREFRSATCLCSQRACRGSFLYFAGSRAFQQVLNTRHNLLHRQALILRACSEPLTPGDSAALSKWGLRAAALGGGGGAPRVPGWLEKWAALVLGFIAEEQAALPAALLAARAPGITYTPASAAAEAKGVSDNRLQNVAITLDKLKMFLGQPGQLRGPPLRLLSEAEALDYLWDGPRSVAVRFLRAAAGTSRNAAVARALDGATSRIDLAAALARPDAAPHAPLQMLGRCVLREAGSLPVARQLMVLPSPWPHLLVAGSKRSEGELAALLRQLDMEGGGGHTAAADAALLYAHTCTWFTAERAYKGFTSAPVRLNLDDLTLDRTAAAAAGAGLNPPHFGTSRAAAGNGRAGHSSGDGTRAGAAKKYGPGFVWGQLNSWFKQTVYEPAASLSAERRGTISLPDPDSCYAGRARYTARARAIRASPSLRMRALAHSSSMEALRGGRAAAQDREALLEHLERRPDAMWKSSSLWAFRNEAKVYGSPMFDAAWAAATPGAPPNPLPAALAALRAAPVPYPREATAVAARKARTAAARTADPVAAALPDNGLHGPAVSSDVTIG